MPLCHEGDERGVRGERHQHHLASAWRTCYGIRCGRRNPGPSDQGRTSSVGSTRQQRTRVRRAPISGALRCSCGGEPGIRTLGTAQNRTHDFQSCTFSLSVSSPYDRATGTFWCCTKRKGEYNEEGPSRQCEHRSGHVEHRRESHGSYYHMGLLVTRQ